MSPRVETDDDGTHALRPEMRPPIDWLLAGEPFVAYRTLRDLLGEPEDDPAVGAARRAMLADPRVDALVGALAGWPGTPLASHRSAGQLFHVLGFLTDLGLTVDDPGMREAVGAIMAQRSDEGPFPIRMTISSHHGGSGEEAWAWALCDAPLVVAGLARLGLRDDPQVRAAVTHLTGLVRDNGWPCAVSKELGRFRGPGRKDDPCPFATLAMLKALAEFPDLRDGTAARTGAETLVSLWADSRTRHPYMFFMGTDFRKIKAPLVWYDLLHVLDVVTRFPWLAEDVRLHDMLAVLAGKADDGARFTPESVWLAWKAWEFGQKKVPSRWVTLLAWRILGRMQAAPASA